MLGDVELQEPSLTAGGANGTATLEDGLEVSYKTKHTLFYRIIQQ